MDRMDLVALVSPVIAIVAGLRKLYPKIDGRLVWGLAVLVSVALCELLEWPVWRVGLADGLKVAAGSIGIMTAVGYGADKAGAAIAVALPPSSDPPQDEKKP